MTNNWQKVKLDEIGCKPINDFIEKPLGGDWGKDSKDKEYIYEVYAIRGTDFSNLQNGNLKSLPTRYIKKTSLKKRKLREGDIVFEISGGSHGQPVGKPFIVKKTLIDSCDKSIIYSNFCRRLRVKKEFDPYYLYFQLLQIYCSPEIYNYQTQSTGISNFHFTDFINYKKILSPQLEEQKRIASILSAFDDKIELNNKINNTLEKMAQAIFKEWFVKFKFPGYEKVKIVDSELGKIPERWRIGTIKDFGKIVTGKTPPTKDQENFGREFPFITIPDIKNIFITDTERYLSKQSYSKMRNLLLPQNSICVSCIATVGLVGITVKESFTNQQINSLIPKKEFYIYFLYFYFKNRKKILELYGAGGTATLIINKMKFKNIELVIPDDKILLKFYNKVEPLFKKYLSNIKENQKLSALRDLLLPKLMSGEVRV